MRNTAWRAVSGRSLTLPADEQRGQAEEWNMYSEETAFMSCEERNYCNDRRTRAVYVPVPADHKDYTWAVCDMCEGHGHVVNPSIDASGLTREDFDDDPDFAEDYRSGVYDISCPQCQGRGSVVVLSGKRMPGQRYELLMIVAETEDCDEFEDTLYAGTLDEAVTLFDKSATKDVVALSLYDTELDPHEMCELTCVLQWRRK